jgi:8-oxo-dGTP pyrophosphatase MutT (NUDIX family)
MEQKIKEWSDAVTNAGCTIHSIQILNEIRKPDGEMLFSLVDANVTSPEGTILPRIVFVRGHACVIVTLLVNTNTGEEKFLMVKQRRIGNGQLNLEFPAGMLDNNSNDPVGVAIRELAEETGLHVSHQDMFTLGNKMYFSSVGGSDEAVYFFGCIVHVNDATFVSYNTRSAGNSDEGESITTILISRDEAESEATSIQVPLGFYLFDKQTKVSDR